MKLTFVHAVLALLAFLSFQLTPLHAADATKPKGIPGHGTLQAVDTTAQTVTLESKKETGGRVFSVTSETKITDGAGNPATLASATVGEDVGVYYTKDSTGKMTLLTLRLGAKTGAKPSKASKSAVATAATPATPAAAAAPAPAPAAAAPAPAAATTPAPAATTTAAAATTKPKRSSLTGKVTAVDATANTLAVHGKTDQTFNITSSTKITGAAGLSAIAVGNKVSVSFTKATDGTVTVTSVKVSQ